MYLFDQETEGYSVNPAGFVLEVEDLDETAAILDVELFFRHPLSNKSCVVIEADDGVVSS